MIIWIITCANKYNAWKCAFQAKEIEKEIRNITTAFA